MSILSTIGKLLAKAAKNKAIKTIVISAALNVASSNIDKAGAKLKVPTEITELAKVVLASEAEKQRDLGAVDAISRL